MTRSLLAPLRSAVVVAVLAVAAGLLPVAATAAWGTVAGEGPQRTVTYDVRVRGQAQSDVAVFSRVAAQTFADRRGWSLGGSLRFTEVPSGGAFTLWLASPAAMSSFSSVCSAQYSCRSGRDVVINDERWRTGTPSWPAVREYRHYVLNHELGHWLGLGHASCPAAGAAAPVMQQQSKGLGGCRSSTWPSDAERRAAAGRAGVQVRPPLPALLAVSRAGAAGTEVHAVDGATRYASFLSQLATSLPSTAGQPWSFRAADHDRDGTDDLYAIEHRSGSAVRVQVLDGASGYRRSLLDTVTALHVADAGTWTFTVADQDGDGLQDLLAVDGQGATGTEVHVLDGATGLRSFRLNTRTALHRTSTAQWSFAVGHHDRDGVPDLYAVTGRGTSGRTEVHVLSGAGGYRAWLANTATPLGPTSPQDVSFEVADSSGDGDDLMAIARRGASGRTEVHVLDGSHRRFRLHAATPLAPSPDVRLWSFDAA